MIHQDEIHLWISYPNQITNAHLINSYLGLLSADEISRLNNFVFSEHRHQYLISRALVRTLLGNYLDMPPKEIRFKQNSYGRPEIAIDCAKKIRFNLSHTKNLIAFTLILDNDIGIDAEVMDRNATLISIADKFLSKEELKHLHVLNKEQRFDRLYRLWTLKESFIKAIGKGLSIPLDKFWFRFSASGEITINFHPSLQEFEDEWMFWTLTLSPKHKIALCVRQRIISSMRVITKGIVPLCDIFSADIY